MSTTPIWPIEGVALDSTGDIVAESLGAMVMDVRDDFIQEVKVYPTLAAGATVVSANADWTLGAYAVVVPINTITNEYHVSGLAVETMNQNAVFQLELYRGAGDDLIASFRFSIAGGFFGNSVYPSTGEEVPANEQIRARLASSDGAANQATATVSVRYHEHS